MGLYRFCITEEVSLSFLQNSALLLSSVVIWLLLSEPYSRRILQKSNIKAMLLLYVASLMRLVTWEKTVYSLLMASSHRVLLM